MSKKANAIAIADAARSASLAARAFNRLEKEAKRIDSVEADNRALKLVSTGKNQLQAHIRCGKVNIQIQGDDFAVDLGD